MELLNKELILKEIPLFAGLPEQELKLIQDKSDIVDYKKGGIIYQEGSTPDAFYCVVSGRVLIYTQDRYGTQTILEYLHRGKYFGIISLLTSEPHSVTAKALNDCSLLVIKREDFDFILKKIPSLAIGLSQTLSRRLKNKDIHQKIIFETAIISVFSSYSQAGKTIYALNLALSLHKETRKSILILEICQKDKLHSLPSKLEINGDYPVLDLSVFFGDTAKAISDSILKNKFGIDLVCLNYQAEDELCIKRLVGILSLLVNEYHYIILDLPSGIDQICFNILNQSDSIHILTSPEPVDLKRTNNLVERLKLDFNFPDEKIKIIINEYKLSKLTCEEQVDLLNHGIFATLPKIELAGRERLFLDEPDSEYAKAIKRISRRVGDCLVGLALGVGAAYGFCHIGILKVIEEENIPIDVVSGSSIGALIASLWVTGKSSREILEIAQEFKEAKYIWGLVDLTVPYLGFIKGKKLYNFLKKYLGNKTFHDLRLPLKIIASDVKKKEPIVLDKGLLIDAVMLSCAMPGVFRPFRLKDDILMDGGLTHPLPTEILFKMGVKKIIAVNVTPSREDIQRQCEKIKQEIASPHQKKRWSLKRYFRNRFKTNILDIIFSSIEVMQSELARKEEGLADVVLHPDTSGLHWLEFQGAVDFARRGEEEARRNLAKIWQMINE